jgi:hypothetical protein
VVSNRSYGTTFFTNDGKIFKGTPDIGGIAMSDCKSPRKEKALAVAFNGNLRGRRQRDGCLVEDDGLPDSRFARAPGAG